MIENLLDGELDSRQFRLLEEADSFDLEDFYLDMGPSSGGVCLITENQMLMTDCYIKLSRGSSYGMHQDTVDDMYQAIYGIRGPEYSEEVMWQDKIMDDGNVLIQLCSRKPSLVWVPEEISFSQFEMLESFSSRVECIVRNNLDYFEARPILFECCIGKGEPFFTANSIREILERVRVKEVENGKTIY